MDKNLLGILILDLFLTVIILILVCRLKKIIGSIRYILTRLARKIGIPEPAEDEEILKYVNEGNKIGAVKRYREITGSELKEASDYVDKLMKK